MAANQLPKQVSLLAKSLKNGGKKINLDKNGYSNTIVYKNVPLSKEHIENFRNFLGIEAKVPAVYWFTLTLRSQLAFMNEPSFPFPVMGSVHLGNSIEIVGDVDLSKPVDVETTFNVPYKEEGSLLSDGIINILQDGKVIVKTTGDFIKIRKRKGPKKEEEKAEEEVESRNPVHTEDLYYEKNIGWKYARYSGDFNPIHLGNFLAKYLGGMKQTIAHGWFSASRVSKIIEKYTGKEVKFFDVKFKNPVTLPSTTTVRLFEGKDGHIDFDMINKDGETCLYGTAKN